MPRSNPASDLLMLAARLSRWASSQASFPVPAAQARLLGILGQLGPSRIGELAAADHSSQPTVTTQVQRMEQAGWIRRETDPDDARATLLSITDAGQGVIDQVRAARAEALDPVIAELDGPALARVHLAIDTLTELLDRTNSPARSARKDT